MSLDLRPKRWPFHSNPPPEYAQLTDFLAFGRARYYLARWKCDIVAEWKVLGAVLGRDDAFGTDHPQIPIRRRMTEVEKSCPTGKNVNYQFATATLQTRTHIAAITVSKLLRKEYRKTFVNAPTQSASNITRRASSMLPSFRNRSALHRARLPSNTAAWTILASK